MAMSANSTFLSSNSSTTFLNTRRTTHSASSNVGFFKIPTLPPKTPNSGRTRIKSSSRFSPVCFKENAELSNQQQQQEEGLDGDLKVEVGAPKLLSLVPAMKLSLSDQAFFLLTFIACMFFLGPTPFNSSTNCKRSATLYGFTLQKYNFSQHTLSTTSVHVYVYSASTSVAFTSFVMAAVPTLYAMARAATSLSKLADTAREELPSTMAAVRLSGMEISDLTLELSDLSQEIADGVHKSTQAVQAAEAGIRQIGSLARQQTMTMIEERANLPVISLQPAVVGAAKKTSQAVGRATKSFMYFISRGELSSDDEDEDNGINRVEI